MESLPLSYYENRLRDMAWRTQLDHGVAKELIARMVLDGPDGSTQLLVDVLEGGHGKLLGALAYRAIETGISIGNGNRLDAANPMVASFAEVCMFKGRLAMLEAVLEVSPRDSSHNTRSLSKSDFLDFLCSTAEEREKDLDALDEGRMEGLVGLAARNWDICRNAQQALDMAYEVNPEHHAWDSHVEDPSGPGAFVREYLMSRKLAAAGPGTVAAAQPGRRRAARAL